MRHRFTAPVFAVLVLALAAFTGSALAGDHHGSGSGDSGKAAKHDQAAPAQPSSPDKPAKQDKQSSTSASNPATGGDNSQGVKPSNTTKHDTYAKASSDQTKKYGNGKTAGQIATQAGYGDATLHGPGNSQPHKTAACPGGHEVDVHALKNKKDKCASSDQKKQPETKSEKSSLMVSFCDMETATTGKLETKSADKVLSHELNGTPEEARDIVPPFTLNGQSYSQLWDANGQAIFAAGCGEAVHVKAEEHVEKSSLKVSFCDMETATTGKLETKSADKVLKHELNGTPEEARDIVPTFTLNGTTYSQLFDANGQAIFAAGCNAPPAAPATAAPAAPATAAPATVAPATVAPATVAPATTAAGAVQGTQATITPAASSPAATPAPAGGVKGAVVALKPTKTKPAGGVLGATTRLGGKVASTTLPFTGLPLWIFALVAAALIGIGFTVRRASANRI
jgi:hypothetical protein